MANQAPVAEQIRDIATDLADAGDAVERVLYSMQLDARLTGDLDQTRNALIDLFGSAPDIMISSIRSLDGVRILAVFNQTLVDRQILTRDVFDRLASANIFAVIVDGSPFVLVAPITFGHLFKSSEDYHENWFPTVILRGIRMLALISGVLVPGLYVAIVNYHQELIPTSLLVVLAAARENVPLPTIIGLLLLLVLFEIIREAGVHTPSGIGSAVTIGGTLVVGQAAVRAGIVSSPIIIVTSAVVIQFLAVPDYDLVQVSRFMLYPILFAAAFMGLFGLLFVSLALLLYMASLRSFGVSYLAPVAPMRQRDWKDTILRKPWWGMNTRPVQTGLANPVRQQPNQKPIPPERHA